MTSGALRADSLDSFVKLEQCGEADLEEVGAKAAALGAALRQGLPVPPGLVIPPGHQVTPQTIRSALGPGPYAVRSSSPHEDGVDRSWAGQFESRIPVELAELPAAIEEVRASGSSERALAYGSDGRPIPVIVQPVVPADAAGIAFSLDPIDGDERYCVIEGVPGLATALADGTVTPTRWRVRLDTGDVEGPVGDLLTAAALHKVVALILDVADWLGRPCDVEWVWDGDRAWLVQARPVTAQSWSPAAGQWTSANIRENVPGIVTPLAGAINYEDAWPENIENAMRRVGILRDGEPVADVARFYGHLYWRVDRIKERLLRLPGFVESSFDETVGIRRAYEGSGRRSALTPRTLAAGARAGVAVVRGYVEDGPLAQRHAARLLREEPDWLSLDWDRMGDAELALRLAAARELHRRTAYHHFRVSFAAEQAQDMLKALADKIEPRLPGGLDHRLLLAGVGDVATGAAGQALSALADAHVQHAEAILQAETVEALPPAVAAGLRGVIAEFGWMAPVDDELALPRWDEDPALALALFKGAVKSSSAGNAQRRTSLAKARAAQDRRVLRASGLLLPALGISLLLSRRYQLIREEMRVGWARANRIVRRAFLALGRRWASQGVLEAAEDVFWLTPADCDRILAGELTDEDARALVSERRAHAHRFRNWEPPHVLGAESGAESFDDLPADANELRGVPCSSGVVTGTVAILRKLEDVASVEAGSILVIKHASPGWTPAFLVAGGLVVEEGGLLSHSSVVARERGLPAVINVPNATTRLRDGQRVQVDGRHGRVTVLTGEDAECVESFEIPNI